MENNLDPFWFVLECEKLSLLPWPSTARSTIANRRHHNFAFSFAKIRVNERYGIYRQLLGVRSCF